MIAVSGGAQAGVALLAAVALHLAAFGWLPQSEGGAASAGDDGSGLLTLEAAPDSMATLVAAWDKPPQLELPQMIAPAAPPPADRAPLPDLPDLPALAVLPAPEAPPRPVVSPVPDEPPALAPPPPPPPVIAETPPERPKLRPRPKPEQAAKPAKAAPKSASEPRPAQRASGAGGGGAAGGGGKAEAATLSAAAEADLTASWGASIRARIERKKTYPRDGAGAKGRVTLRLVVQRNGALAAVSVAGSSGHPALDAAALKAVRAVGKFPPAPKGLGKADYSFTLPVSFQR